MRKIWHSFIAIVVLVGPATFILAHEKLTRTPAQEVIKSFDPPPRMRQAYTRCAEASQTQRSAQCSEYVSFFEHCAMQHNGCALGEVFEVLSKAILSLPLRNPKLEQVAITEQQITPQRGRDTPTTRR